ncbi:MAG TPA: RNA methyltransferase [Bdellovibrionota bacterium]|nr:RNA methyltransferase [Bdellovibrionota bacterium]
MDPAVTEYLASFVSDKRLARMDSVLDLRTRRFCVVLENVLQKHNASAVLRSADAFGVQDVHLITNDNKFRAAKGISRGAHKWLSLTRHNQRGVNNTQACFEQLRTQGYKIACLHPHAEAREIGGLDLAHEKFALVIGSEREGLSDYALKNSDLCLKYPMYGYSESLNLSVLAALCMSDLRKQLNQIPTERWQLGELERAELKLEWIRKTVRESRQLEQSFVSRSSALVAAK